MFDELVISGCERRPTHTWWTFLVSLAGELSILAILLVIPTFHIQAFPLGWREMSLGPPPAPGTLPQVAHAAKKSPSPAREALKVPPFIPPHARILRESVPAPAGEGIGTLYMPGAIPGARNDNRWTSIFSRSNPGPPGQSPASGMLRVGGDVEAAKLIYMVRPEYPLPAREAHVQGSVVLAATIAEDGTVAGLRYISGPALLVKAVEKAVLKWRYRPTLLNGQPTEVETTITVIFTLKPAKREGTPKAWKGGGKGRPVGAVPSTALRPAP